MLAVVYEPSDTAKALVINDKYAKVLGFKNPGEAVGKTLGKNERFKANAHCWCGRRFLVRGLAAIAGKPVDYPCNRRR